MRLGVQRVDLFCEVLLHGSASDLERRRDLAGVHREVARENREALHLLEARTLLVDVVDDALQERVDALVASECGHVCSDALLARPALDLDADPA